ncbi:hypothetical protein V8D89_010574 [Ganoderma adspersum]
MWVCGLEAGCPAATSGICALKQKVSRYNYGTDIPGHTQSFSMGVVAAAAMRRLLFPTKLVVYAAVDAVEDDSDGFSEADGRNFTDATHGLARDAHGGPGPRVHLRRRALVLLRRLSADVVFPIPPTVYTVALAVEDDPHQCSKTDGAVLVNFAFKHAHHGTYIPAAAHSPGEFSPSPAGGGAELLKCGRRHHCRRPVPVRNSRSVVCPFRIQARTTSQLHPRATRPLRESPFHPAGGSRGEFSDGMPEEAVKWELAVYDSGTYTPAHPNP